MMIIVYNKLKDYINLSVVINGYLNRINEYTLHDEILDILYKLDTYLTKHLTGNSKLIISLLKTRVDLIDLHFKYAINSEGYLSAKSDFYSKLK